VRERRGEDQLTARDYSTISPSAKALLLVKAESGLPYAREAARILFGDAREEAPPENAAGVEARRLHFELRARSVDAALDAMGATRVLELAAGLSFRGLARAERAGVFYLDTDLTDIIASKRDLVAELHPAPVAGTLRLRVLDALDSGAFVAAACELPPGPIAVVCEGLLMYLDAAEKARLAANVRAALVARGGAWITADVYVRTKAEGTAAAPYRDAPTQAFLARQRVDENKFDSFEGAAAFFAEHGFLVARQASRADEDPWGVRETWILLPA
jgi:O-methyltransferase involved in polyketide biosynthesis